MPYIGTLIHRAPPAEMDQGSDAAVNSPVFAPTAMFRQPVALQLRNKPGHRTIKYERGTLIETFKGQVIPPVNSLWQPQLRGPIRNYYVRDWYWRHPQAQSDDIFPNGHILLADGELHSLPGASAMLPCQRLTFNLRTPAWSVPPNLVQAGEWNA